MRTRPRYRRGYSMILVVLFLVVFLGIWGQAARQVGSMLRIEQARAQRIRRDAARLPAEEGLAKALAALEAGFPPTNPYTCSYTSSGGDLVSITFTRDSTDTDYWDIAVASTLDSSLPVLNTADFVTATP